MATWGLLLNILPGTCCSMFCGWASLCAFGRWDWVPKVHCDPLESHGCSLPQIGSCTMSWADRLHGFQMQWSSSPKQGFASLSNWLREGSYSQTLILGYAGIIATLSVLGTPQLCLRWSISWLAACGIVGACHGGWLWLIFSHYYVELPG